MFRGHQANGEAAVFIGEYLERQRLAKLGFTTDSSTLSTKRAEAFVLISQTIDAEQDKASKKGK